MADGARNRLKRPGKMIEERVEEIGADCRYAARSRQVPAIEVFCGTGRADEVPGEQTV